MNAWAEAWEQAEASLTGWLADAMEHTEGVEAFRSHDLPRSLRGEADAVVWCLALSGGDVDVHRATRSEIPGGCWHMAGEIVVRGRTAPAVRECACAIYGFLPIGPEDIPKIVRCYATAFPTSNRILVPVENSALENEIAFESRIAIKCAFVNPTEENSQETE